MIDNATAHYRSLSPTPRNETDLGILQIEIEQIAPFSGFHFIFTCVKISFVSNTEESILKRGKIASRSNLNMRISRFAWAKVQSYTLFTNFGRKDNLRKLIGRMRNET